MWQIRCEIKQNTGYAYPVEKLLIMEIVFFGFQTSTSYVYVPKGFHLFARYII